MKDKEEEDKKKREERIKARMEDNLANAKLPPRMEMHEKSKVILFPCKFACLILYVQQEGTTSKRVNPNKYQPEEATFKPKIKKDIPDFEQQQKEFEDNLQSKKKERPKTQFKTFEFQVLTNTIIISYFLRKKRKVKEKLRRKRNLRLKM